MGETEIHVTQFNPLQVTLPKVERFVGTVRILLPDLHVQLMDLSMGIDLLKGAHIGSDGPLFSLDMTIPEPGITPGQMMELVYEAQDILEEMWRRCQELLDERGALLDRPGGLDSAIRRIGQVLQ